MIGLKKGNLYLITDMTTDVSVHDGYRRVVGRFLGHSEIRGCGGGGGCLRSYLFEKLAEDFPDHQSTRQETVSFPYDDPRFSFEAFYGAHLPLYMHSYTYPAYEKALKNGEFRVP